MIVNCVFYNGEKDERVDGDLSDALDHARSVEGGFIWIGLHEPDTSEFDLVAEEFGLHPLAVEDAVHAHQRPKLERYDDTLFIVLKSLHYEEEKSDITVGEIMLFVGRGFVVSVRHGQGNPLTRARKRFEKHHELKRMGPSGVLYAVLDEVVDNYVSIAQEVDSDIIDLENLVFSSTRGKPVEAIYSLKREVLEFRGAVQPLVPVVRELAGGGVEVVPTEMLHYFRDINDHLLRVTGSVDASNELLTSVLNANLTQANSRMNEDMRRISAVVAIIAVPTMIAGLYGMNFEYMPELGWTFGYPLVLTVMVVVCFILYRLFRRNGWL
ncbi:magnesium/cobalt transporter CorA [Rhizohabitans arisaemae]|uniref:magnesium/cobalt transporter CorA n=1 Tax=Rhizohabitans arisaemae TaxID=2720610 RepID=UPI0024B17848|nr:magnesium/cobalt transporter CorA [Rhizohabitans arisaemae]